MNEQTAARHWLVANAPKAAPAIATSTVLILARIWNAAGAEHSTGNAWLMGTLAAGAAVAGYVSINGHHGDGTLAATAFVLSGALAVTGVAAYADSIAPGLVLWAIATVLGYVLAARHWRHDRHETTAHAQHMEIRREDHRHAETIEIIRARTQTEALAYAVALSDARAHRDGLPGFDHPAFAPTTHLELPAVETKEN
ncbi:hypothetical protein ACFWAT_07195 [Streptomyces syringium]|uniref:hypothetical protein n=1 Tax=Streptomyces syringium TaxID=76729 RepID=UPI00364AE3CE